MKKGSCSTMLIFMHQSRREKIRIRNHKDKKPYYKQSGIVFVLVGTIFLINAVDVILQMGWLFCLVIGIAIVAIVYAVVSSVMIEKKNK